MPDDQDRDKAAPAPQPDREDLLSPARALRESAGRRAGQRVGDSGPLANPEVSFPGEADAEEPEETPG